MSTVPTRRSSSPPSVCSGSLLAGYAGAASRRRLLQAAALAFLGLAILALPSVGLLVVPAALTLLVAVALAYRDPYPT